MTECDKLRTMSDTTSHENISLGKGDGPKFPAYCERDGWVQVAISASAATTSSSLSHTAFKCPKCGEAAFGLNGTHDFTDFIVKRLHEVSLSRQQLRRLRRASVSAQDPDDYVARAKAIDPQVGEVAATFTGSSNWRQLAGQLWWNLAQLAAAVALHKGLGTDELIERVWERVQPQEVQTEGSPAPEWGEDDFFPTITDS